MSVAQEERPSRMERYSWRVEVRKLLISCSSSSADVP